MSRVQRVLARLTRRRPLPAADTHPAEPPPPIVAPTPAKLPAPDLAQLAAEATHHADRLRLYRARVSSSKASSLTRLRELEQTAAAAEERLRHARGG
jgi:hypothetical protein